MENLVIGVPARDEAATIVQLADALERGCAWLGEGTRCELVLAYQAGVDDTLERWQSRRFRLPNRVLGGAEGVTGKGRNVKLLISYAQQAAAHLLLVDADLGSYPPSNVARFAHSERLAHAGVVLPLWCRPKGQGNSTDFLACPLIFAGFGARVRQPLAGQMLLSRRLLASIDVDQLPDDYGIDVALTMSVLDRGLPVDQVVVPFPDHEGGGNSHVIMHDVACALLRRLGGGDPAVRTDVATPARWWVGSDPVAPSSRTLRGLIEQVVPSEALSEWSALFDAPPDAVRDLWCDRLVDAVRQARAGRPVVEVATGLVYPFLVHAEYRRRVEVDVAGAEAYVGELCDRVAAAL
jgi:hypothetical protein